MTWVETLACFSFEAVLQSVIEGLLEDKDAIVERIDGERAAIGPMREQWQGGGNGGAAHPGFAVTERRDSPLPRLYLP
jgi:hypothetical protein